MGAPSQEVIALFLIFRLFLSSGSDGLLALVIVALRLGIRDVSVFIFSSAV
jgi:hypothetical protein